MPSQTNKRRHLRHQPDAGDFAMIDVSSPLDRPFHPTIPALIVDEAFKGCGLIVLPHPKLTVGARLRVQVGKLAPVTAEIRWKLEIDTQVHKIGLMYLE